jgi:hypothetical protein
MKESEMQAFQKLIEEDVLVTIEYCSIYGECWKECGKRADPTCGLGRSPASNIFNAGIWSRIF